jgi:hypothetical protein
MHFDHSPPLWLGAPQHGTERDLESLAAEGLLHRWGVEPGALHTSRRSPRPEERR